MDHMALHPRKTKFMLITTRQKRQLLESSLPAIYINGEKVEEVTNHKILGVTIDNNLSWSTHIQSLSKKVASQTYLLK